MTGAIEEATDEKVGGSEQSRVSGVELFSDLVFVFAITRLTTALVEDQTWLGFGHVLLLFGMIWWMYGGYIWLTNAVRPDRPIRKLLLLGAMAGFLMMGLAIPGAFRGEGLVFALGYLLVILIHTGLFLQASGTGGAKAIAGVAPFNLASAILLIIGTAFSAGIEMAVWTTALVIQVLSPFIHRARGFSIEPSHFVERYGLLVLIALGESIVAVGAGGNRSLGAPVVVLSVLGLGLTAALWWAYFSTDEPVAEEALRAFPEEQRPLRALAGFFYAQIPMMLGIVAIAAAVRTALPDPTAPATLKQTVLLAGGAAGFLVGDVCFRAALRLPGSVWRILAVPLVLLTIAVGVAVSIIAQVAAIAAILVVVFAAEHRQASSHPASA